MENFKELILRIFRTGSMSRVFSLVRFAFLLAGMIVAAVYFATHGSIILSLLAAVVCFVFFRYGQIKGYLP